MAVINGGEPGGQGAGCVLLVRGHTYLEVLSSEAGIATLMGPTGGRMSFPTADMQAQGFTVCKAQKLIKKDGSWMYMCMGEHGVDIYAYGEFRPAYPLGQQQVRKL